jgi:hypothetical protein
MTVQFATLAIGAALACGTAALLGCGADGAPGEGGQDTPVASRKNDQRHRATTVNSAHQLRGRPVKWIVLDVPKGRRVRIGSSSSWCPDIPHSMPRFTGVHESDLDDRIVLTAYLSDRPKPGCLAVAVRPETVVWLRQDRLGRRIYDGSQSPPLQRWPSAG